MKRNNRYNRSIAMLVLIILSAQISALAQTAHITVNCLQVENKISRLMYGSNIEDVNHEIYGGFYDQRIFGESFEEPATGVDHNLWQKYTGYWYAKDGGVMISPGFNTTSDVEMNGIHPVGVEPDHSAKLIYQPVQYSDGVVEADIKFTGKGESGGLLVRVSKAGVGNDVFDGYEISLARDGKTIRVGKHAQNFKLLKTAPVNADTEGWNRIKVICKGQMIIVYLNDQQVLSCVDDHNPILRGKIGLRTWRSAITFRNIAVQQKGRMVPLKLLTDDSENISYNWDRIQTAKTKSNFSIDSTDAYNGKRSQVITLTGGVGRVGIANSGLNRWGIAVRKAQTFQGRLYLKGEQISGPVTINLESTDGSKIYASKKLTGVTATWQKFPFTLTSNDTDPQARLTITINTNGKLWVDQVVLMGTGKDQFEGLPIRADIGKMLVAQGLTFLRYAGTMVNSPEYRFKNMIGDPDKRPPYRGHWNHYTTNGFGIEEFLKFCESTSITPCFTINIYETPQDMADMIEYLNGDVSTPWGAKRSENGHPKPYEVKYIEIGNEEVIFNGDKAKDYEAYVQRFNLLYPAMKQKDSSIKLVHSAWWRPESPSMEYVYRELVGKADYWDLHVGGDDPNAGKDTDKEITNMLRLFKQWDPQQRMKIAVFEENGSKHGIQRALGHATNLNAIRKHSESVLTSSPANALQPYLQNDNDWDQGQIFFTPGQVWGMPPFYSQQMQVANHLPLRVFCKVDGALDVTATRSENGDTLILHVVNTTADAMHTTMELQGFKNRSTNVLVSTLSGSLTVANTPAKPTQYRTINSTVTLIGNEPVYNFLPYSYTILKFRK